MSIDAKKGLFLVINNTMGDENAMYYNHLISTLKKYNINYKEIATLDDIENSINMHLKGNITLLGIFLSGSPLMVTKESIIENLDTFLMNTLISIRLDLPILGICFGSQLINNLYGGKLRKLRKPFCEDAVVYYDKKKLNGRFCLSYIIDSVPPSFNIIAHALIRNKLVPCYIKHKNKDIYGCLFHPEYHNETNFIIQDFIKKCL